MKTIRILILILISYLQLNAQDFQFAWLTDLHIGFTNADVDLENCIKSVGIDGAENMINKANSLSPNLKYIQADLDNLNYNEKFDVVFSMEVLYYLKDPLKTLKYIYSKMINDNGFFIMGIDHYLENKSSLSWPKDLDLDLKTLQIDDWVKIVQLAGFKNVIYEQVGGKENWAGTLVIYAQKKS